MPRRLPPHVELWKDRHGRTRVYFRRGKGARVPLPPNVASEEFKAAYADALSGSATPKGSAGGIAPGTVAALVVSYLKSPEYAALRATSKAGYRSRVDMIRRAHGHRTLAGMTREGIVTKILQPFAEKPGQRLAILKMLRILIRHAIDIGWLKHDPSQGIKRPKTQEIRSWTDAEIGAFEAHWSSATRERLAFALMLYTGQRRSDVHRMTWADVSGDVIRVVQQKTGAKLAIPLHHALRAELAQAPREHVTILNTAFGKPFTVDGFSGFMRDAITAAGLPLDCQPHGLRKAAGRRLAEAGCTAHQIMAILGHKSLAEAERYTREADQARLAQAAIHQLEGRNVNGNAQTPSRKFGKSPKKRS